MRIVPREKRWCDHQLNWEMRVLARLHQAPGHGFCYSNWSYEADAKHYGRRLIYGLVQFVVLGLRDISWGNRRGADDARQ